MLTKLPFTVSVTPELIVNVAEEFTVKFFTETDEDTTGIFDAPAGIVMLLSASGTTPVDQLEAVFQSVEPASFPNYFIKLRGQSAPAVHDSPTSNAPISAAEPALVCGTRLLSPGPL